MRLNPIDQRAHGRSVLERFAKLESVPAELKGELAQFEAAHAAMEASVEAAADARRGKKGAFGRIGEASARLDQSLEDLANWLVACRKTKRRSPLGGYSAQTPSQIADLGHANKIKTMQRLLAKIDADSPPEEVARVLGRCQQQVAEAERELTGYSGPAVVFDQQRSARQAAMVAWKKAFTRLKLCSRIAFEDSPETFKSLFAPPTERMRPITRRPRKNRPPPVAPGSEKAP